MDGNNTTVLLKFVARKLEKKFLYISISKEKQEKREAIIEIDLISTKVRSADSPPGNSSKWVMPEMIGNRLPLDIKSELSCECSLSLNKSVFKMRVI